MSSRKRASEIIAAARSDGDQVGPERYSDKDLLRYLNDGVSYLQTIIYTAHSKTLPFEEERRYQRNSRDRYLLPDDILLPGSIYSVTVDDCQLEHLSVADRGNKSGYWSNGEDLRLDLSDSGSSGELILTYARHYPEIPLNGKIPLPRVIDPFLTHYIVRRVKISDASIEEENFNILSKEQQGEIQKLYAASAPRLNRMPVSDYSRHVW